MKKALLFSAFLLFFIHPKIQSQQGWFWQNPLPQGNILSNVSFVGNNIVYVSGYGGTLLKSTDSGNNFSIVQTIITENLNVNFINELTGFSTAVNGGILRTITGGTSWEYFPVWPNSSTVQIQYITGSIVFALCSGSINNVPSTNIYKSSDLGSTWSLSLKPDTNTWVNAFHFIDQNSGFAVGRKSGLVYSKIYKTTNGGNSWDSVASNIHTDLKSVYLTNPNAGYAATTSVANSILKTINGCLNWDTVYSGDYYYSIRFFDDFTGYAKNYNVIIKTTNAGLNWQMIYVNKNVFLKNINEGLGIGNSYNYNFLYKTTNSGSNWTPVTSGYSGFLWDVTFINENTGFAAAQNGALLKTTNGGSNWTEIDLNIQEPGNDVEIIDFVNDNTGYLGIDRGYIGKTTNGGVDWKISHTGNFGHNHGISFPSIDTGYSFTKYGNHLKTTNGGLNWIDLGHRGASYYGHACFINNNIGFAGGQDGFISITRNGGATWDSVIVDSVSWFFDVGKADDNTWFAVGYGDYNPSTSYNGFIYRSTDAGYNWTHISFPDHQIGSIYFPNSLTGYAATNGNIMYKTTNMGDSWFPTRCINASNSYGIYFVNDLTGWAVGGSGQIIKTTTGGGELIGIEPVTSEIPKTFLLYQNYPNPFNPVTKIKFNIPANYFNKGLQPLVQVRIYDILGREVAVLVNEQLTAGKYEVTWDASNFSSGVYFYMLTAGEYSVSKKMLMIK
jgi:photosystem II stability/assembly factor-like uncharacterized protein